MNTAVPTVILTACEDLDLSYLHTVSGGDADFEKDMLQSLIGEMSEKMASLSAAIGQDDQASIRLQSHSLKNLATLIGASTLAENFKAIETQCEGVPAASIRQRFLWCEAQWERSKNWLAQRLVIYGDAVLQ